MMTTAFLASALTLTALGANAQVKPVRTGAHSFTIQWLSFDKSRPGTVQIRPVGSGRYSIQGEQRNKQGDEYVTIDGTFTMVGRELRFEGTVVSRIASINNGNPCERTGPQVFKATGARKYWRLQQMLNCDGIVTDYIDIFF